MLTVDQIENFKDQGFLVLNNFASSEECRSMRERARAIVDKSDDVVDPRCVFDSKSKTKRMVSYSYFSESTNKVSLFFEASAVDANGKLLMDKHRAIMKIGHALHDYDPVFANYAHSPRMHSLARDLGYKKPLIAQSPPVDESSYVPLEINEGAAILMSGELFHKSNPNVATSTRQAFGMHFIEGDVTHHYPPENWLQRPGGFGELRKIDELSK